ncbi:hypothetical protein NSK_000920 [Nannochloropsis salina CCMP1776]|uniref:Uncharacterized protein n=1 Tax=Nannochloropsis salina CCMP1776 TaxID=1027361 RepID=A0A4D9DFU0_9STRA|nr:hypothetical protein NSK_000920 [Nannochloropsis salina CCMP1776]|eukprot:TFJ87569.1 hypothetical protein NSK_000920 [Nannochloropsis salina CCMP1776]
MSSGNAFVLRPQPLTRSSRTVLREGFDFMEMGSRFLNELLPWGDAKKGMWAGKRDAMVVKYMEKTGISKEQAEREVDEYLKDKDAYIAKARAEEAKQKQK